MKQMLRILAMLVLCAAVVVAGQDRRKEKLAAEDRVSPGLGWRWRETGRRQAWPKASSSTRAVSKCNRYHNRRPFACR